MAEDKQTSDLSDDINNKGKGRGRRSPSILFPRNTLSETLRVSEAIWKDNAGDPYDPILLSTNSLGISTRSSAFESLLRSSSLYGLTEGNSRAKNIVLTTLGLSIVAPTDETSRDAGLRSALLKPEVFQKFYLKYNRKSIPKDEIIKSVIQREFGVLPTDIDACYEVIMKNVDDFSLKIQSGSGYTLYLDQLKAEPPKAEELSQVVEKDEKTSSTLEESKSGESTNLKEADRTVPKQIFVAHGKNRIPLEQLERILNKLKVPYKVAEEEAHAGRPVGKKVADLMRQCTSGIFIFTADEATQSQGSEVFRPSDNVVYELGAASVIYEDKIVILKEHSVSFASDFGDLGYISFETDHLDSKAADLMLELVSLGFLEVRPT